MLTTSSLVSVRSGKGIVSGSYPLSTRAQWPTGGRGIWCFSQIFASPTSESPNSFASVRIGVLQTRRYNSARVIVSAFSENMTPSEFQEIQIVTIRRQVLRQSPGSTGHSAHSEG